MTVKKEQVKPIYLNRLLSMHRPRKVASIIGCSDGYISRLASADKVAVNWEKAAMYYVQLKEAHRDHDNRAEEQPKDTAIMIGRVPRDKQDTVRQVLNALGVQTQWLLED